MSVQTQTCLIVSCDACDESMQGFEESFTVHFDEGTNLEAELRHYDWLVEGDKYYCEACVEAMQAFIAPQEEGTPGE